MALTEGKIAVGGTTDFLDTTKVTQTDNSTVHREVVVQGDPEALAAYTKVTNSAPAEADYGGVTRPLGAAQANRISTTSFNSRDAANLAADATFQGAGEDVSGYGRVGVSIVSDNATDGTLTMETSHDDVTYGGPERNFANTTIAAPHMWNIVEKYFRIKYVNGTTAAMNLSIQVHYSNNADIILGHQLDETLAVENEAVLVRPATNIDLDLARKHITGQRAFFFFGHNDSVGTSFEDVTPEGGDYLWPSSAAKVEVLSSNANDTSAGAGVRQVELHGLSATGVDQDEIITMNGTAAVESSLTYTRVNKMHSENVGTYGGSHQGDVTVRVTGAGNILGVMTGHEGAVNSGVQYGEGELGAGRWSCPLGKVLYITDLTVTITSSGNNTADVILYEREGILNTSAPHDPRRIIWNTSQQQGLIKKTFKSHIKIKALTDLWFRARSSAGTVSVDVSLDFYLLDQNTVGA